MAINEGPLRAGASATPPSPSLPLLLLLVLLLRLLLSLPLLPVAASSLDGKEKRACSPPSTCCSCSGGAPGASLSSSNGWRRSPSSFWDFVPRAMPNRFACSLSSWPPAARGEQPSFLSHEGDSATCRSRLWPAAAERWFCRRNLRPGGLCSAVRTCVQPALALIRGRAYRSHQPFHSAKRRLRERRQLARTPAWAGASAPWLGRPGKRTRAHAECSSTAATAKLSERRLLQRVDARSQPAARAGSFVAARAASRRRALYTRWATQFVDVTRAARGRRGERMHSQELISISMF
eukprot:scaffold306_cov525-Prasinococcus_capsulatus_cf.AAC.30